MGRCAMTHSSEELRQRARDIADQHERGLAEIRALLNTASGMDVSIQAAAAGRAFRRYIETSSASLGALLELVVDLVDGRE